MFGGDYLSFSSLPVGSEKYSFAPQPLYMIFTCFIINTTIVASQLSFSFLHFLKILFKVFPDDSGLLVSSHEIIDHSPGRKFINDDPCTFDSSIFTAELLV